MKVEHRNRSTDEDCQTIRTVLKRNISYTRLLIRTGSLSKREIGSGDDEGNSAAGGSDDKAPASVDDAFGGDSRSESFGLVEEAGIQ